jgi:hypothetical protein
MEPASGFEPAFTLTAREGMFLTFFLSGAGVTVRVARSAIRLNVRHVTGVRVDAPSERSEGAPVLLMQLSLSEGHGSIFARDDPVRPLVVGAWSSVPSSMVSLDMVVDS